MKKLLGQVDVEMTQSVYFDDLVNIPKESLAQREIEYLEQKKLPYPVININDAIKAGGWKGILPRLAFAPAHFSVVAVSSDPSTGRVVFTGALFDSWSHRVNGMPRSLRARLSVMGERAEAILPLVPTEIRPEGKLNNYRILWEAEWRTTSPRLADPYLLYHWRNDLYYVLATWDLTKDEIVAYQEAKLENLTTPTK